MSHWEKVQDLLQNKYGVSIDDCTSKDAVEGWLNDGETPEEIVDYLADKRDLTEL